MWQKLKSSNLRRCWYFRTKSLLAITFLSGGTYLYYPISWSLYMRFRRSSSKGSFFSRHILHNTAIQWKPLSAKELSTLR